jgi:hypothetical protein
VIPANLAKIWQQWTSSLLQIMQQPRQIWLVRKQNSRQVFAPHLLAWKPWHLNVTNKCIDLAGEEAKQQTGFCAKPAGISM